MTPDQKREELEALWNEWRVLPAGIRKNILLSKMMGRPGKGDGFGEGLAQLLATNFIASSNLRIGRQRGENLNEDIYQAARLGVIRAFEKWNPTKGRFSTIAKLWARHEMQRVAQHAMPVSIPKDAYLPRAMQDAAARFAALHGRDPEPGEIQVTKVQMVKAQAAQATFIEYDAAELEAEEALIAAIDNGEVRAVVLRYLESLSDRKLAEAWDLTPEKLVAAAKRWKESADEPVRESHQRHARLPPA